MDYQVACPQCHSHLKSARPVPAGMKVKCPHCGRLFDATPAHALVAGAAPVAAARAATSPEPMPSRMPLAAVAPEAPTQETPPAGRGGALTLIVGGAGLLLVLAVVLVIYCFSGDERTPSTATDGGETASLQPIAAKKKPPTPPLIALSPDEQKKVDATVQKGVAFLKARQRPDGRWDAVGGHPIGSTALPGLTLLEAGVPPGDPVLVKAAAAIRSGATSLRETYDLSLAILFLNRLGDPKDRDLIQRLTLRLVAGQYADGAWGYNCPVLSEEDHKLLLGLMQDLSLKRGAAPADLLRDPRGPAATLRARHRRQPHMLSGLLADLSRPATFYRNGPGDNSNTQFAILALWAARSHGLPLDHTLALINQRFRASQQSDGRWCYRGNGEVARVVPGKGHLPTMTCAGLLGVAVGFGLQEAGKPALRPDQDEVVKKGLKHLGRFLGQPGAPGAGKPPMQELYFLWSAERVAVLYQLKTIEGKKWYHWGMETLLAHQRADGSWLGGPGTTPVIDTSFAILFLHRVNLAKDLTDKLMELGATPVAVGQAPARKD